MPYKKWHISESLFLGQNPAGVTYSMVTFHDRRVGIAKEGEPMSGFYWAADSEGIEECTREFLRLTGMDHLPPLGR